MSYPEGVGGPSDAVARAAYVEHVRNLLRTPLSFPAMGLANPALTPSRLVEVAEIGGAVQRISMGYGDTTGSAGRFVLIISGPADRQLDDLAALLESEAQRLGVEVTQNPPVAPELTPAGGLQLNIPLEVDGMIVVEGLAVPAHLRRQGRLWAAHITVSPGRVVTAIARGVDPGSMQLNEIRDLYPYLRAWEEYQHKAMVASAFLNQGAESAAAPPQGLDAHIALLRNWITARARGQGLREPVIGPASGTADDIALWQAAVATQCKYAKQEEHEASAAVAAMVNQALQLAERSSWFGDRARVKESLEELARYTVFESDVPSRRAQEWWGRLWVLLTTPLPPDEAEARERQREFAATETVWLKAWERWALGDDGHGRRR